MLFWKLGKGVGIACVILGVVYWGNLWTARKYWQPRKAELEAIADTASTRRLHRISEVPRQ